MVWENIKYTHFGFGARHKLGQIRELKWAWAVWLAWTGPTDSCTRIF